LGESPQPFCLGVSLYNIFIKVATSIFYAAFIYNTLKIGNTYSSYINNFTTIVEVYYWFLFLISGLFLLAFSVCDEKLIVKKMSKEALDKYIKNRNSFIHKFRFFLYKSMDIAFILFVGIVAGDFSLFFVMFFVEFFTYMLLQKAKKILENKIKEEEKDVL